MHNLINKINVEIINIKTIKYMFSLKYKNNYHSSYNNLICKLESLTNSDNKEYVSYELEKIIEQRKQLVNKELNN